MEETGDRREEHSTTVHQSFANGRFVEGSGGDLMDVINPARDTRISQVPDTTAAEVGMAVEAATRANAEEIANWNSTACASPPRTSC